ncbi:MAG: alpha/beta fold hydrolase [Gammaproteobacteria bacterium]
MALPTSIAATTPPLTAREDFWPFWRGTLDELAQVTPEPVALRGERSPQGPELQWVTLRSLGERRITAYLLRWRNGPPRPLVVYTHGYGSQVEEAWSWARRGLHVVGVDVRGFGRSRAAGEPVSPAGYVLTGIDAPATSILRGAVCDFVRARQWAQHQLGALVSRTVFHGHSFGGAVAVMAAAVDPSSDLLAVGVPTFGWAQGRRRLVRRGSGKEINDYLADRPDREATVLRTLSYFDPMNFAPQVPGPSLVGVGLHDDVVPPETVYAIVNHLPKPVQVMEFPTSHTGRPEEAAWTAFETRWLALALAAPGGSPSDARPDALTPSP